MKKLYIAYDYNSHTGNSLRAISLKNSISDRASDTQTFWHTQNRIYIEDIDIEIYNNPCYKFVREFQFTSKNLKLLHLSNIYCFILFKKGLM